MNVHFNPIETFNLNTILSSVPLHWTNIKTNMKINISPLEIIILTDLAFIIYSNLFITGLMQNLTQTHIVHHATVHFAPTLDSTTAVLVTILFKTKHVF